MNLQQLEYIISVDRHRHFLRAAEACNITQATLSMMIKKLEEELQEVIFDRSKQPVVPTAIGEKIIEKARRIINETENLKEMLQQEKGVISGVLKVGIIPTVAPYLLPLILKKIGESYPKLILHIYEVTTDALLAQLKSGHLDVGILSTPLQQTGIQERLLYTERYFLYINPKEEEFNKTYILPKDIQPEKLWLLSEGHCLRAQILNLCELKKQGDIQHQLHYEAGSIETLVNLVDHNYGLTIIPEMAAQRLSTEQRKQLRYFAEPMPYREIGMVTHQEYVKERLVRALRDTVLSVVGKRV